MQYYLQNSNCDEDWLVFAQVEFQRAWDTLSSSFVPVPFCNDYSEACCRESVNGYLNVVYINAPLTAHIVAPVVDEWWNINEFVEWLITYVEIEIGNAMPLLL